MHVLAIHALQRVFRHPAVCFEPKSQAMAGNAAPTTGLEVAQVVAPRP